MSTPEVEEIRIRRELLERTTLARDLLSEFHNQRQIGSAQKEYDGSFKEWKGYSKLV